MRCIGISVLFGVLIASAAYGHKGFRSAISPDGKNEIRLYLEPLSYEVWRAGKPVVLRSAIGMTGTGVYEVELVARNDGVAYRFVTQAGGDIVASNELSEVHFPGSFSYVLHKTRAIGCEESVAQFCRDFGDVKTVDGEVAYLPLLAQGEGVVCAVTDSDVRDYPIWNLRAVEAGFSGVFARCPLKTVSIDGATVVNCEGQRLRKYRVLEEADYLVKSQGPRTFPWRVFALGDKASDLLGATIVDDLAGPQAEGDFSWVRPGKVAWDWWNGFDNKGDEVGCTTATYERFIDFASKHGIEYVILDEGWSEKLNIWKFHPNVDVVHLIEYASKRNVGIILWMAWAQVKDDEERVAAHFAKLGAKGFKVDFMDSGDAMQERFLWKFAAACARNRMLVDYHGAHRPTGLSKVYPNVLNWEGVHGLEQMKAYRGEDFLQTDVAIAFTRMLAGPLDYTPGAMDNFPLGDYPLTKAGEPSPTWSNPGSLGTRSRQMAMLVLYSAPLQMLCDSPTKYERERECFEFMAKIPTTWKKTVGLDGSPETHVALARQVADDCWYVAAIAGAEGRTLRLDMSFLRDDEWSAEVFKDTQDADRNPMHYDHEMKMVRSGEPFVVRLAAGGGFVARLMRKTCGTSVDFRIRDPYVLAETNRYYLYETKPWYGGVSVKVRTSADLKSWSERAVVMEMPEDVQCTALWAPEVHKYNGKYYLLVTVTEEKGARPIAAMGEKVEEKDLVPRGTWGFVSDLPTGPFKPLKRGPLPPVELMTLDGTLYVEEGKPYLVYCHEWCQTGNGTIEYARLTDDLTYFAERPRVLLTANETLAGAGKVTDGCFLYRSETSGVLHLIWSNFVEGHGYCVLTRHSLSGLLTGPWSEDRILFGENGGHGMIFRSIDGKLLLSLHQPNEDGKERLKLYALQEYDGYLRLIQKDGLDQADSTGGKCR